MDRSVLMGIVLAFLLLLLLLMFLGWRGRRKRQAGIPKPPVAPDDLGKLYGTFEGQYVATTKAGNPLDRVVVSPLGFRAHAFVIVAEAGIVVQIPGKVDPFIPASAASELRDATWTIDRVVEQRGLQAITWSLGDTEVDSYFRMDEPKAFSNAVRSLLPTKETL